MRELKKLETKVVYNKPGTKAEAAVIWLHGLGADCNDFVPIVAELALKQSLKFIFPNAPVIPITINGGMQMRGWYDISDFSALQRVVDVKGILNSVSQIEVLIEELIAQGFLPEKIILAGFSQGGAICYYSGLNSKYQLGGIMILSSYLPDATLLNVVSVQQNQKLPILICHGVQDPVVSIAYAKLGLKHLQKLGLTYEWHEYNMQHSVCAEEIAVAGRWLLQILKNRIS